MRALAKASVNAVERALHRNMNVLLVNLAVRTSVLGVAHASSIVAPTSISAIVGAGSDAAILATKARLAPAGAVKAETVARAVPDTDWNGTVRSIKVW